ncbi:Crowded nuclei [Thalictrum thalictroides]|uniref:Crowded nuclei n=1 Tax=Thalictrum thalictroides TaxID=46969 RepID=A0A7J6VZ98_THATH|nr:Crowded nuclei [Thalictrum thalictroides]
MTSSYQKERLSITPFNSKVGGGSSPDVRVLDLVSTPVSGNRRSSVSIDEGLSSRLRETGFDEDSIKRKDRTALIAYITKLESEVFDYQYHMGLLLMEKKDWSSKNEQVKASADSDIMKFKLEHAAHLSALADAKKREDSLKKSLAIEKECLTNIEKSLHEMRAEAAGNKIAVESKMAEACSMLEDAQKKFAEAEAKRHAAEMLQREASQYHRTAERKLHEVEEREDALRRQILSFKSECDAKEMQISLERQALCERQRIFQQEQERLLDGQALLSQREKYISEKHEELGRLEKASEELKSKFENELKALNKEKTDLNLKLAELSTREKAVREREAMLDKKEAQLLCAQEKIASKEHDEIQRLVANQETALEIKKAELEKEMEQKRMSMESQLESKRREYELREVDLRQLEEMILEKEQELDKQSSSLLEKEKDITERLKSLQTKEENLCAEQHAKELEKIYIQEEKEQIKSMKVDVEKSLDFLENKRKEVEEAQLKLDANKHEMNEVQVLEMRLKDELDSIRAQKCDLLTEAENLKAEKSKFEIEWELIDEKRDELRNEAERISEERKVVSKFLKDERDRLKVEKDALEEKFKNDLESLSREREDFTSKMERERSEWFSKIQLEQANFVQDVELQKIDLENRIRKRRDEIERYLREKEETFEQEKAKELRYMSSQKEMLAKEWENIRVEIKKLDNEGKKTTLDSEQREKELAELKKSVEELEIQRKKLKEQRELLQADREKINVQIQQLTQLENLKVTSEISEIEEADGEMELLTSNEAPTGCLSPSLLPKQSQGSVPPLTSSPFSWISEMIFRRSPEKSSIKHKEKLHETEGAKLLEDKYLQKDMKVVLAQLKNVQERSDMLEQNMSKVGEERTDSIFGRVQPAKFDSEEPKVILEVPLADEIVKTANRVECETGTEVNGDIEYPDEGIVAGRKRGSPFPNNFDASLEETRDKKKRRQEKHSPEVLLEETTSNCDVSILEEKDVTSRDQISSPAEIDDCVDGNQASMGGLTKSKDAEISTESEKMVCSQNLLLASPQDDHEGLGFVKTNPRNAELVSYYLQKKILGEAFTSLNYIKDGEIYGEKAPSHPSQLFEGSSSNELYFFTKLKNKYPNGNTIDRTAGNGSWIRLMSMSLVDLEVLAKSGPPKYSKHATKILPVVQKQHLLFCTLLMCNAAAMEALPIFLDAVVTTWGAILISVTLILLFGELLELLLGKGHVALFRRAELKTLVNLHGDELLELLLGKGHVALFRRAELKTLVNLHGDEAGKGGELTHDETTIIAGALELAEKTARDAMTPISDTFAIDINAKLDWNLMKLILEKGHSRVSVYYEQYTNIIGLVLVKNLLTIHPADEIPVKNVTIRWIPRFTENMPLYDILNEFQKGHSHMAAVIRSLDEPGEKAQNNAQADEDVTVDIDGEGHFKNNLKSKKKFKSGKVFPLVLIIQTRIFLEQRARNGTQMYCPSTITHFQSSLKKLLAY